MQQAAAVTVIVGVVLLVLGRRLFWFFVAAAGFLIGIGIAERVVSGPESTKLIIALIAGVVGAVLGVLLQKAAIAVAGFVIGGYVGVQLLEVFTGHETTVVASRIAVAHPVAYIIGGVIGAVLVLILFDWALIVLSSFSGASLILRGFAVQAAAIPLLFWALVIVGIVVQAGLLRTARRHSP